jgi:sarcosine oxidase
MNKYDFIIVGLGAVGSAAAFHLARRGTKVLGLDRFTPPHAFGSSHGQTRIIREAYFEHPLYVPLIQRAYELWSELEKLAGRPLLRQTGGLMIGAPDSAVVAGALQSARRHGLRFEILEATEIIRRFPALRPAEGMIGVWEPRAGILFPEICVEAHLRLARKHGAELRIDEPVLEWKVTREGVRAHTGKGEYCANQLLLCAGSWIKPLLGTLASPLTVERQVQYWFEPSLNTEQFQPQHCPIHIWEYEHGRYFYGFPDLGNGVKVARHHEGPVTTPESINRNVEGFEVEEMRKIVGRFLPGANGPLRSAVVCQYTNTPDYHFWIDRHPEHRQVMIASACSGHGFKFSSVVGETLADLLVERQSHFDLTLFQNRPFS